MSTVPLLKLNNGAEMPALGFGVFQTPPDETVTAVETALSTGYRHVDTAAAYGNERQVGQAVAKSGHQVFLETKIWISDYGYDETLHGFDKSAGKLGVDRIDLLILHQALPSDFDRTLGAYRALEKLLADGKVRAIGVLARRRRRRYCWGCSGRCPRLVCAGRGRVAEVGAGGCRRRKRRRRHPTPVR
jgi:diketogulonate reductase-like aldo/keto reductase